MAKRISVTAARHACKNVPVFCSADGLRINVDTPIALKDIATGNLVPTQLVEDVDGPNLCWILEDLPLGESREYEIVDDAPQAESVVELIEIGGEKVDVLIGGSLFTSYYFGGNIARPFLYPIIGPGGLSVTRNYPMAQNTPGETTDHKHHRSVWVAHGDVNGADNWSEQDGHARVVHREFLERSSGPVLGRIRALNDWVDNQGRKIMEEERTVTVYNLPDSGRIMDLRIVFRATEGDVRFGDTKEGGIASVRVATSMDGNKGGMITNSYGGVTESETWGKRAHWCDYSGTVDGRIVGISIFDYPENFRYPTYWHVRDYGLFAANPFALSAYTNNPNMDGSYVVKAGGIFPFKYRIYIHEGDVVAGNVGEQYHGFINPTVISAK